MDRFERLDAVNRTQPADDNIFLQKTADAGLRYGNSPGANPALLGARDVIMGLVENRVKDLEERILRRLDEIERRPAAAPTRRSTGITWQRFKEMDAAEQQAAITAASVMDMVNLFAGKNEENFQAIESRLARLEKDLTIKEFEASLLEGGA